MSLQIDRTTFFSDIRNAPFGGRLTQQQVDGVSAILSAWNGADDRHLAYILATAFHETGGRMVAVREGFARTDARAREVVSRRRYGRPDSVTGHVYYGRGHVQLTWKTNYRKMGEALGIDLVNNPDLALDSAHSVRILIEGMTNGETGVGDFTSKSLEDYFNASTDDPVGARRIVNGTDKASLIAGYHRNFLDAITRAKAAYWSGHQPSGVTHDAAQPDGADLKKDRVTIGGALAGIGGIGALAPIMQHLNNPWAFAFAALILVGVYLVISGRIDLKRKAGA